MSKQNQNDNLRDLMDSPAWMQLIDTMAELGRQTKAQLEQQTGREVRKWTVDPLRVVQFGSKRK